MGPAATTTTHPPVPPPPDYRIAALRVKDACGAGSAGQATPGPDPPGPLTRIGSSRETGNAQAPGDARGPARHAP